MVDTTNTIKEWQCTSSPTISRDRSRERWRLALNYTQPKRKTVRVKSSWFKTEEEAKAAASWWRLSWEQGNKGKNVNPGTLPDHIPSQDAALPSGKSKRSVANLNAVQERQFKKQRREGMTLGRGEWLMSTIMNARERRHLMRASTLREVRKSKQFYNRLSYLKRRTVELEKKAAKHDESICRIRRCLLGGVSELLLEDRTRDDDDGEGDGEGDPEDVTTADGPATSTDEREGTEVSVSQMARLYAQALAVLDVLEEERMRDLLLLEHHRKSYSALKEAQSSTARSPDQISATEAVVENALEEASLIRRQNTLEAIAKLTSQISSSKYTADTILSWRRQFLRPGGYFKRDGRGVREREWILSEEDLAVDLLAWLKAQKGVTAKKTNVFINEVLLRGEEGT